MTAPVLEVADLVREAVSARAYPYGRPAERGNASPNRFAYFAKRVGLRWQIWHEYEDGHADPNGASEWRSAWALSFWWRLTALRIAAEMQMAHNQGAYLADLQFGAQPRRGPGETMENESYD